MSNSLFKKGIEKKALQVAKIFLKKYKNVSITPASEKLIIKKVSKAMGKIGKSIPFLPGGEALGMLFGREGAKLAIKELKKSQK